MIKCGYIGDSTGAEITIRMFNMPEEWLSQVHLRRTANWKVGHCRR